MENTTAGKVGIQQEMRAGEKRGGPGGSERRGRQGEIIYEGLPF